MKTPPFMAGRDGYCYASDWSLVQIQDLTAWRGTVDAAGYRVPGTEPPLPWCGETVVCIGSGPSLTQEDCASVESAGLLTVAANDSWRRAPFAAAIFATDHGWWQQHIHEIDIPAQRWTDSVPAAQEFDLFLHVTRTEKRNSGAKAIELAMDLGAARVLLLGFDCSIDDGLHWHGPHTRTGNPDQDTMGRWQKQFSALAQVAQKRNVQVVNCSRKTSLTCFPREKLCEALDNAKKMEAELVP